MPSNSFANSLLILVVGPSLLEATCSSERDAGREPKSSGLRFQLCLQGSLLVFFPVIAMLVSYLGGSQSHLEPAYITLTLQVCR